jgi:hypothetical protein
MVELLSVTFTALGPGLFAGVVEYLLGVPREHQETVGEERAAADDDHDDAASDNPGHLESPFPRCR